jgi:hypothetical protein
MKAKTEHCPSAVGNGFWRVLVTVGPYNMTLCNTGFKDENSAQQVADDINGMYVEDTVLQPWVQRLTYMQQSVLIAAVRGPDGLPKNHISKVLLRWYRRCIMYSAFGHEIITDPYEEGGGSFAGPCTYNLDSVVEAYLKRLDEMPHHFQLHFMHASEILGYCHPIDKIRQWWYNLYVRIVRDAHLNIEPKEDMMRRLGDNEEQWREAEEVTAD